MMTCGRCGNRTGKEIEDMRQPLRIMEYAWDENRQKYANSIVLCKKCRTGLKAWLEEGGYDRQEKTWLPVKPRTKGE